MEQWDLEFINEKKNAKNGNLKEKVGLRRKDREIERGRKATVVGDR